jgi:hypothetical protein
MEVANPLEPAALLMVVSVMSDELQVTDDVRFCVVPSEYVPVAINCRVVPIAMPGFVGVTAMEISVPPFGEICAVPLLPAPPPLHDEKVNNAKTGNIIKPNIFFMSISPHRLCSYGTFDTTIMPFLPGSKISMPNLRSSNSKSNPSDR